MKVNNSQIRSIVKFHFLWNFVLQNPPYIYIHTPIYLLINTFCFPPCSYATPFRPDYHHHRHTTVDSPRYAERISELYVGDMLAWLPPPFGGPHIDRFSRARSFRGATSVRRRGGDGGRTPSRRAYARINHANWTGSSRYRRACMRTWRGGPNRYYIYKLWRKVAPN